MLSGELKVLKNDFNFYNLKKEGLLYYDRYVPLASNIKHGPDKCAHIVYNVCAHGLARVSSINANAKVEGRI